MTYRGSSGVCDFLGKILEVAVEHLAPLPLLLLHLDFVLIAIAVLALPVPGFVKLDVRGFAEELDVLMANQLRYPSRSRATYVGLLLAD